MAKPKPQYAHHVVMQGSLTGQFYYCKKVKVLDGPGAAHHFQVVGEKIDITDWLQPYLLKKYRAVRGG